MCVCVRVRVRVCVCDLYIKISRSVVRDGYALGWGSLVCVCVICTLRFLVVLLGTVVHRDGGVECVRARVEGVCARVGECAHVCVGVKSGSAWLLMFKSTYHDVPLPGLAVMYLYFCLRNTPVFIWTHRNKQKYAAVVVVVLMMVVVLMVVVMVVVVVVLMMVVWWWWWC